MGGGSLQTGRTVFSGRHVRGCLLINGLCRVEPKEKFAKRLTVEMWAGKEAAGQRSLLRTVAGNFTQSNQALPNPFDTGSTMMKRSEPFEGLGRSLTTNIY